MGMGPTLITELKINRNHFWDVDVNHLDMEKSSRLIIERVFSLGELDEMAVLIRYYGKTRIIQTLQNINYLDPKTLNFITKLFDLPLDSFKCYTRKSSTPNHWNS
jgi:hypothetical protein